MRKKAAASNLTLAFIRALFELQGFKCYICLRPYGNPKENEDVDWLHLDHWSGCCERKTKDDPICGKCVRGLLCESCNARGLSWYEKLPEHLKTIERVNEYLGRATWPAEIVRRSLNSKV
ncbi:endonuclease domain-containing protein [Sphaerisporangium viridialbum]|uniref:endonuclease domain-containing protein n=1 Tax=Sphaerisporangium viridialbum TaxID=46189 RepID=UPI003C73F914